MLFEVQYLLTDLTEVCETIYKLTQDSSAPNFLYFSYDAKSFWNDFSGKRLQSFAILAFFTIGCQSWVVIRIS